MKLSISVPDDVVTFLDAYAAAFEEWGADEASA